jgi:hypothetical protein
MPSLQEHIRVRAYYLWHNAGQPSGNGVQFFKAAVLEYADRLKEAERRQRQEIDLQNAKAHIMNRQSCREVYRDEILHVVEYPPQLRVCKFKICGQNFKHELAMPFMQFVRYLGKYGTSLHVSFTNEPIQDIHQEVFFPPLPNVWYPSLQVCLMTSPNNRFETVIANFWNTRYLDCEDWYSGPVLEYETPMKTYVRWERMTKEDPKFITNVSWTHPCYIADIPQFDHGGSRASGMSGKREYGTDPTNRADGPIRNFAIVKYGESQKKFD